MIKYEKLLKDIINWVKEIGHYQKMQLANTHFKVYQKDSEVNLVTDVDVESERMLIKYIKDSYPGHTVLGEETGTKEGSQGKRGSYEWVIDPIDGTTSFIHGFPMYAISVALKYNGTTEIGVVYAPIMDMLFTAGRNMGAYLNRELITVSNTTELIESLIATGFQYSRQLENTNLKYFSKIINQIADIRRTGSAALDLCFVASGQLDGYWEFDLNEWDIAAGALILKEAGGIVNCFEKEGHKLLVCGNPNIQPKLQEVLNRIH